MKLSEMREALNLDARKKELVDLTATSDKFVERLLMVDLPNIIIKKITPDVCRLIRYAAIGEVAEIDSRLKALGVEPDEPKAVAPVSVDEERDISE